MKKKFLILGILIMLILPTYIASAEFTTTDNTEFPRCNIERLTVNFDTSDLPSYFSWRDIDGVDFTTAIRHQTPFHSCETFAIVAAVEAMVQYEVGYPFGCDLSEAHLFFCSGGNLDWGSFPENDTNYLQEYGVPDEACWPYPRTLNQYPLNTTCPDWQNRTVKIKSWGYLPEDIDVIKAAVINNGPVPTYMHVYKDFQRYKKGIYRHIWGESVAPHLVTIVGYNDDPGYWICKNSWGRGWGENGWFKIRYGECSIEKMAVLLTDVYGNFPIIYVDDNNTIGPWNGSEEYPYQHIQDAIDNAYEGYTIYVKNGTYYENIIINKTINLDGENKLNTIIDGSYIGNVIRIDKPNVRVSGFTVQNSGDKLYDAGIKTLSLYSNTTISNNIIKNNDIGIYLNFAYPVSTNLVKENIINHNREGIFSLWSDNNNIENNVIQNNTGDGIEMERSQFGIIRGNTIIDNEGCGIYLRATSNRNIVEKNNIIQNVYGIKLDRANINIIRKNNFIDNNQQQATFIHSFLNRWIRNHWSNWIRIIPKAIRGQITYYDLPWFNFDFLPSKKQIEI